VRVVLFAHLLTERTCLHSPFPRHVRLQTSPHLTSPHLTNGRANGASAPSTDGLSSQYHARSSGSLFQIKLTQFAPPTLVLSQHPRLPNHLLQLSRCRSPPSSSLFWVPRPPLFPLYVNPASSLTASTNPHPDRRARSRPAHRRPRRHHLLRAELRRHIRRHTSELLLHRSEQCLLRHGRQDAQHDCRGRHVVHFLHVSNGI
jgi:hypothetical protein